LDRGCCQTRPGNEQRQHRHQQDQARHAGFHDSPLV
jgi:hypothetical protein